MNWIALVFTSFIASTLMAGTCCNTPTVWTIKNLDKSPVKLKCNLEKSATWKKSGGNISMVTGTIAAGGTYSHHWSDAWYGDGMGMIPGDWACKAIPPQGAKVENTPSSLQFSTDWGENVTITWNQSKGTIARAESHK